MTKPPNLLKVPEAAEEFGVTERTVWNWIHDGQLPRVTPSRGAGSMPSIFFWSSTVPTLRARRVSEKALSVECEPVHS
jgi:Helix-turn-helix domain